MNAITLTRDDGSSIDVLVRPLKVREYQEAFNAYQADDESKLVGLCCQRADEPKPGEQFMKADWPLTLTPESHEKAWREVEAANSDFFAWYGRRVASRAMRDPRLLQSLVGFRGQSTSPNVGPVQG